LVICLVADSRYIRTNGGSSDIHAATSDLMLKSVVLERHRIDPFTADTTAKGALPAYSIFFSAFFSPSKVQDFANAVRYLLWLQCGGRHKGASNGCVFVSVFMRAPSWQCDNTLLHMYALVSVTSMLATRGRRTASGKQTP